MILPIAQAPQPILSQRAKKISRVTAEIKKLISDMKNTLDATTDPFGVGLAAPQVGKSLQIFIIKPSAKSKIEIFINPILEARDNTSKEMAKAGLSAKAQSTAGPRTNKLKKSIKLEGCLSLPSIWGNVKRPAEVVISYLDEKGTQHTRKFTGFRATIIQHEFDHLQGILFTKRVLEQKGKLYQSQKNQKGDELFEEIEI